ncbi:MAG TPA: flagellar hook-length control protein FliK [Bryobacteraceae bacterium]|nr:flagellar hook-length control protein FliK [Bryobacteraceae bacterium]
MQATPGQPQSNRSPENQPDQTSAPAPAVKDAQTAAPTGNTHPSAAAPARDIHLQLHQGDQRVDVRLSERSGEVHVAVRTADPQLAGALRDDLPGLSDRLEQSGFRADTWHAAMAAMPSGERRIETAGSAFSNPQESGRRQPDQGQENQQHQQRQSPRQPKAGAPQNSDSRRKDFQWLMSQLP